MFLEKLAKQRIIEWVDPNTFQSRTITLNHPKLVFGEQTFDEHDNSERLVYPVYVYDGETFIGTYKFGRITYKGNARDAEVFVPHEAELTL